MGMNQEEREELVGYLNILMQCQNDIARVNDASVARKLTTIRDDIKRQIITFVDDLGGQQVAMRKAWGGTGNNDGPESVSANLIRVAAIAECLKVATQEYSEAQRAGLDSWASWECAREGLRDLLETEQQALRKVQKGNIDYTSNG